MVANYYWADTGCKPRLKIIYGLEAEDIDNIFKETIFRIEYNKEYEEHSYCRLDTIKKDLL